MAEMDLQFLKNTIATVMAELGENPDMIPVEVSGRHVHLSSEAAEKLFGGPLTPVRGLSQPGQFLCKERVRLIGPRGVLENIAVLGPVRSESQVEVSLTDARELGVDLPVRQSGDLSGTPGIIIASESACLELNHGLIVALRHIHMTPADADRFKVADKDVVSVRAGSGRTIIFEDVLVRVSNSYRLAMHIDFDEGNACGWTPGTVGQVLDSALQKMNHKKPDQLQDSFKAVEKRAVIISKKLIAEKDIIDAIKGGASVLRLPVSAILTPLAADTARERGVQIETL